ncbi:DUF2625 domain-containing protein [Maribacter sp. BPC-D8]|uniref:DUF2625 domain-containing protein n=1 Tax=Maribacter sp. BPC-D8 TaxID=3053613 RepID=UPI002B45EB1B|nr:DUF2625 domain-containing protein [Maribacter sp. BPC-D8]WRI30993.1 DUF2625 domain-containing protein [Maribacter sp. BPC-D8]
MKTINELINIDEPGWVLVAEWINDATNKVEILPKNEKEADNALYQTQVSTRSPMGAIIYETGGLLIDHGWIRILGSGNQKLDRTLPDWNKGKTFEEYGDKPSIFLVADDVVGGFFAINGGALGDDLGNVYYFAPDALEWESMDIGYSDFLWWTLTGDLSQFYANARWTGWEKEITEINGNQGIAFYPFLWTEHKSIDDLTRKIVPISEIWAFQQEALQQLKNGD